MFFFLPNRETVANAVCLRLQFPLDAFVCGGEKASLVRLYLLFPLLSPNVSCRSDYSAANLFAVTTPAGNHSFNYHHLSSLWIFREGVSTLSFSETQTSRQEQLRASAFIFRLVRFITVYTVVILSLRTIFRERYRDHILRVILNMPTHTIYRYTDYISNFFIFMFLST